MRAEAAGRAIRGMISATDPEPPFTLLPRALTLPMEDVIDVESHRRYLEELISDHVDAKLTIVSSRAENDGRLGRCKWGRAGQQDEILLPSQITENEAENCLIALAMRGDQNNQPNLNEDADRIDSGIEFLTHLVLHEIAHVRNRWGQDKETDCDIWAHFELKKLREKML